MYLDSMGKLLTFALLQHDPELEIALLDVCLAVDVPLNPVHGKVDLCSVQVDLRLPRQFTNRLTHRAMELC